MRARVSFNPPLALSTTHLFKVVEWHNSRIIVSSSQKERETFTNSESLLSQVTGHCALWDQ